MEAKSAKMKIEEKVLLVNLFFSRKGFAPRRGRFINTQIKKR